MDILKKNLVLFIVIGCSLISSIVLVVLVLGGHDEMTKSVVKVEEIKKQIKDLSKQKPSPHPGNIIRMKKDIDAYKENVEAIQHIYGQPYRDAILAYYAALDMDEKSFLEKFGEFWTQNANSGTTRYQLCLKFNSTFTSFKLSKARENFKQIFQKNTVEKIDDNNINDIVLSAIGVPRLPSETEFKRFLFQNKEEFTKMLDSNNVVYPESLTSFSFNEYMGASTFPKKEEIPQIIDSFLMVGDLLKLAIGCNIKDIQSITRGSLFGTPDGKFTRYRFSLEVQSDMVNLQKFMNGLNESYVRNRVYVIRNVVIEAVVDKAKEIITEKIEFQAKKPTAADGMMPGTEDPNKPAEVKKEEPKKPSVPYFQERNYGKPIIGGFKRCRMIIDIDYVVYNRQKFAAQE